MCTHMCRCLKDPEERLPLPRIEIGGSCVVSCLMWVLGTELWSYGRAACPLIYPAISLVLDFFYYFSCEIFMPKATFYTRNLRRKEWNGLFFFFIHTTPNALMTGIMRRTCCHKHGAGTAHWAHSVSYQRLRTLCHWLLTTHRGCITVCSSPHHSVPGVTCLRGDTTGTWTRVNVFSALQGQEREMLAQ